MTDSLAEHYLKDVVRVFRGQKKLADGAVAQVSDEEFFRTIDAESNSIALIMKHMAGNMRSRWTDFLTSDGEKADRHRDTEFVVEGEDRAAILERWEAGWRTLFDTLESLKPEDAARNVTIRGESHTVVEAVNRQLSHYGQHTGQIVFLAKHLRSSAWQTLSIPRGQSEVFNKKMTGEPR
ncbi:MAG TPA: DinB family protein [Pyrinomonadaceae bacterium]